MIEEEHQQSNQTKTLQLIHANTKISKQQASQINLMKLVKQCQLQFQMASNFRECSHYLQELAIIYLKQHQFLKKDIEILQNSLINQSDDQQQKKEIKKKTIEKAKPKPKSSDGKIDYFDNQNQFSVKEIPRNIIPAEKLLLVEQQRTPITMQQLLKRNNNQQTEYEIDSVVKDLSQIYKCSLTDILNKKNQELKNKKKSNHMEQSQQQLIYNFNNQEQEINEELDNFIEEESYVDNANLKYQVIEQKQEISKIAKKESKRNSNQEAKKQVENRNKKSKLTLLKRTPELDSKINEDTDEVFKNNLQIFMRHKEKINDLSLEVNFLQLEPEFWKHEDELIGLINKISFCQDSNQKNNQEKNNFFILDNLTTEIDHKKLLAPKFEEQSQSKESISEFVNFECYSYTPQKIHQLQENQNLYQNLILDLKNVYGKQTKLTSENYFETYDKYESNKSKAFYNLLVMSRVGMLKIQNIQNDQCFSEIQIII